LVARLQVLRPGALGYPYPRKAASASAFWSPGWRVLAGE